MQIWSVVSAVRSTDIQVARQGSEPFLTAQHHTLQSWHERFKKNSGPFTRRIQRLQQQGIGLDLKTPVEREQDAETKRRLAEMKAARAGLSSSAQVSPKAARKSLVELVEDDDEDDDIVIAKQQSPRSKRALALGRAERIAAAMAASPSASKPPHTQAGPSGKAAQAETPRKSKTPESHRPSGSTSSGSGQRDPRTEPVLVATAVSASSPGSSIDRPLQATAPRSESGSDGVGPQGAGPAAPAEAVRTSPDRSKSIDLLQPERPPTQRSRSSTRAPSIAPSEAHPERTPEVRPPSGAVSHENNGATTPDGSQPAAQPQATPATGARPRAQTPRTVALSQRSEVVEVVVPRLSRSPRPSSSSPRGVPRASTSGTSAPRRSLDGGVRPLTPAQKVERGAQLVAAARETYKAHISAYSEKYGCAPTELFAIVAALGKQGAGKGGTMYWDDVERGLRDRFGY